MPDRLTRAEGAAKARTTGRMPRGAEARERRAREAYRIAREASERGPGDVWHAKFLPPELPAAVIAAARDGTLRDYRPSSVTREALHTWLQEGKRELMTDKDGVLIPDEPVPPTDASTTPEG